jgi:hypothetical protein
LQQNVLWVEISNSKGLMGWSMQLPLGKSPLKGTWIVNEPIHVFKVDVATKAFDSVACPFLLEVLQHRAFTSKCLDWLLTIVSTTSTRVPPNNMPGERIVHARGLRHGDPLSPLVFLHVMQVSQALIRKADTWGVFKQLPTHALLHRASL